MSSNDFIHGKQYDITVRVTYNATMPDCDYFETDGLDTIYPGDTPIIKAELVQDPPPTKEFTVIDATPPGGGQACRLIRINAAWQGNRHSIPMLDKALDGWSWTLVLEGVE